MTNWRDPAREVATMFAFIKLTHVMAGLYLWEFVLNLGYDYSIIMGTRKLTLSSIVCSSFRSSRVNDFMPQSASFTWDVVGARYSLSYYSS